MFENSRLGFIASLFMRHNGTTIPTCPAMSVILVNLTVHKGLKFNNTINNPILAIDSISTHFHTYDIIKNNST